MRALAAECACNQSPKEEWMGEEKKFEKMTENF